MKSLLLIIALLISSQSFAGELPKKGQVEARSVLNNGEGLGGFKKFDVVKVFIYSEVISKNVRQFNTVIWVQREVGQPYIDIYTIESTNYADASAMANDIKNGGLLQCKEFRYPDNVCINPTITVLRNE